jgi:hypothetical protein
MRHRYRNSIPLLPDERRPHPRPVRAPSLGPGRTRRRAWRHTRPRRPAAQREAAALAQDPPPGARWRAIHRPCWGRSGCAPCCPGRASGPSTCRSACRCSPSVHLNPPVVDLLGDPSVFGASGRADVDPCRLDGRWGFAHAGAQGLAVHVQVGEDGAVFEPGLELGVARASGVDHRRPNPHRGMSFSSASSCSASLRASASNSAISASRSATASIRLSFAATSSSISTRIEVRTCL